MDLQSFLYFPSFSSSFSSLSSSFSLFSSFSSSFSSFSLFSSSFFSSFSSSFSSYSSLFPFFVCCSFSSFPLPPLNSIFRSSYPPLTILLIIIYAPLPPLFPSSSFLPKLLSLILSILEKNGKRRERSIWGFLIHLLRILLILFILLLISPLTHRPPASPFSSMCSALLFPLSPPLPSLLLCCLPPPIFSLLHPFSFVSVSCLSSWFIILSHYHHGLFNTGVNITSLSERDCLHIIMTDPYIFICGWLNASSRTKSIKFCLHCAIVASVLSLRLCYLSARYRKETMRTEDREFV